MDDELAAAFNALVNEAGESLRDDWLDDEARVAALLFPNGAAQKIATLALQVAKDRERN